MPQRGRDEHRDLGAHHPPARPLDRLRERLPDDGPRLHGERVVGVPRPVGPGSHLSGLQGAPLLVGRRHAAFELRAQPRGVPRRGGPLHHRSAPRRLGQGAGSTRRLAPHLDDDALDAARQPRRRRRRDHHLRPGGRRGRPLLGRRRPRWHRVRRLRCDRRGDGGGRRSHRRRVRACFRSFRGETRRRRVPHDLLTRRDDRRGHRPRPHGTGVRGGRLHRPRGGRHRPPRRSGRSRGTVHRGGARGCGDARQGRG